jgi:hypothetical protein
MIFEPRMPVAATLAIPNAAPPTFCAAPVAPEGSLKR